MKNIYQNCVKYIFSLSLGLILIIAFSIFIIPSASATSKVEFEGGAENFVFLPDGDWTKTDLFGEFKDMMPGDTRTERIIIKNTAKEYDYVKIYLRAEPLKETSANSDQTLTMEEFLLQFQLTVSNNNAVISDALASEAGGLSSNVLLGTFEQEAETTITATLSAPTTMTSEYMDAYGEIDWIFTAECYKNNVALPYSPDTGSQVGKNGAIAVISGLGVSLLGGTFWAFFKKK